MLYTLPFGLGTHIEWKKMNTVCHGLVSIKSFSYSFWKVLFLIVIFNQSRRLKISFQTLWARTKNIASGEKTVECQGGWRWRVSGRKSFLMERRLLPLTSLAHFFSLTCPFSLSGILSVVVPLFLNRRDWKNTKSDSLFRLDLLNYGCHWPSCNVLENEGWIPSLWSSWQ